MNESELRSTFPEMYKSVMACKALETEEEKNKLFKEIIQLFLDKAIYKLDGSPVKWRENCLDYLVKIIPLLDEDNINLVYSDKESFYKKFCFSPTKKRQSLYLSLQKKGPEFLEDLKITRDEIYLLYTVDYGISPFEVVEDENLIPTFIESLDEFIGREPIPFE